MGKEINLSRIWPNYKINALPNVFDKGNDISLSNGNEGALIKIIVS